MRNLWYKNALIYSLDVETFQDSNGDGIGDFPGLTNRLDYLAGLDVNCLWLLPFYPSPNRDNGYDIVDYYGIDPRLGNLGDFVECMHQAHERGIRVLVDLVVNHTSDQHPWFQAACRDKNSPFYDYYIWSETRPPDADQGMVFPGHQESIWTYNETADAYYFHRFYAHQPDLNIANPAVRTEICKIMGFWLELGVSGFRLDAAPFLIELKGIDTPDATDPYDYLWEFHEFLSWRRGDAILLAEANVSMETIPEYVGTSDLPSRPKIDMLFNFMANQYLFLALAREQAAPLQEGMHMLPDISASAQWVNFVRNHDELDLGRLSAEQRNEVFQAFAPDASMRLYERGIRRRLPPMLDGDQRRIKLVYSLLFTLPGTPVLRYGEEIGMGDDLTLAERTSVRTPMQWSKGSDAGFSSGSEETLVRPLIDEGPYSFTSVNVADQRSDPDSLLNTIERMARMRKECPEIGWGSWEILPVDNPAVLVHCCTWHGTTILAVHNFSSQACTISLDTNVPTSDHVIEIVGNRPYQDAEGFPHHIDLQGYGYRWFRMVKL